MAFIDSMSTEEAKHTVFSPNSKRRNLVAAFDCLTQEQRGFRSERAMNVQTCSDVSKALKSAASRLFGMGGRYERHVKVVAQNHPQLPLHQFIDTADGAGNSQDRYFEPRFKSSEGAVMDALASEEDMGLGPDEWQDILRYATTETVQSARKRLTDDEYIKRR